jgi:ribosomal protein L40E
VTTPLHETLFNAIAHGDEKHRAWLKQAIDDHFAGRPVLRPDETSSTVETRVGDPLAAVRWICSDCNTVNGIDRTNCNGCQLSRELSEKHFAVNTSVCPHGIDSTHGAICGTCLRNGGPL